MGEPVIQRDTLLYRRISLVWFAVYVQLIILWWRAPRAR